MLSILAEANPILRTVDEDGCSIVIVTLMHGEKARLFREDFDRIMSEGYSPLWCMSSTREGDRYVAVYGRPSKGPKFRPAIADLVTSRKRSQPRPTHVDRDPLNLRRDNLLIRQKPRGARIKVSA